MHVNMFGSHTEFCYGMLRARSVIAFTSVGHRVGER